MKILMINSVCGIKSTGRICADIADVLTEQGHECKIAYGRDIVPQKSQKYAVRIGNDFGVKIHAGLARLFDSVGFHSRLATKKFIKWVEKFNPDIIHLHNLHGYYIHLGVLFKYLKKAKKPIVWTLHDCWAFTGHCSHFDFAGCQKWKNGCKNCPQKKQYPKSIFWDGSKRNYKKKKKLFTGLESLTVVTPSKWLADLVKDSFLNEYPVKIIRNGIDTKAFKPTDSDLKEQYGLQSKKIVLGVASDWGERKGLQDYIKLSKLIDNNFKIVLIGLKKEQIAQMPEEILSIERTNSVQELAKWYTAADVFLNLTYEDNYPTVNLEAQACGTPVITYRTGGSVESVDDNLVVDKGDIGKILYLIKEGCYQSNSKVEIWDRKDSAYEYIRVYEGSK